MTQCRWATLAIPLVLAWAAYAYLRDPYQTFDARDSGFRSTPTTGRRRTCPTTFANSTAGG